MSKEEGSNGWEAGIWSRWTAQRGISLPSISSDKAVATDTLKVFYSKTQVEALEASFEMTVADHISKFHNVPIWARPYKDRSPYNILTKHRSKRLHGHIVNRSNSNLNFADETVTRFRQGGYIFQKDDPVNRKLLRQGVWIVEKELIKSRSHRLLVYRFLPPQDVLRIVTFKWKKDDERKKVRLERNSEDGWKVAKNTEKTLDIFSDELDSMVFNM